MDFASLGALAVWVGVAGTGAAVVAAIADSQSHARQIQAALWLVAGASVLATTVLAVALVSGDFALVYVADNTSASTSAPYRLAALWGATEGSLLFLATMMALVSVVSSRTLRRHRSLLLRPSALVMALLVGALLTATATFSSPFDTLEIPAIDGGGLLAILRHPAMLIHPPILYLGHTTLLVPFAITVGALVANQTDLAWLRLARRWLLISWTALTFGMVGGSMWAYVELGWGGFWAWDSVENTALLPWLAATAFLHTSQVQERSGRLVRWNAGLAMLPFVLTVLGIYLTRSGLTGSVHAFAESPIVGRFTLALLVGVAVTGVGAAVRRRGASPGWNLEHPGEIWYLINAVVLLWAILVVVLGSAYPLLSRVGGDSVAVAPRWYVVMLFVPALILLGGIALDPRAGPVNRRALLIRAGSFGAVSLGIVTALTIAEVDSPVAMLIVVPAAVAALFVLIDLVRHRPHGRRLMGGLAHLGIALVLFGAAGSALGAEYHGAVETGEVVRVGDYDITIGPVSVGRGEGYSFVAMEVLLSRGGDEVGVLVPEWRGYDGSLRPTPEPALRSGLMDDVVVAISRVSDDASVIWLDVFVRPLVVWVWLGALLIGFSGLVGLATTTGSAGRRRRMATAMLPLTETTSDMSSS
jgi:cytochrome c-type biogenesis protein CcmF